MFMPETPPDSPHKSDELHLICQAQSGGPEASNALNRLLHDNDGWLRASVNRLKIPPDDRDDALQGARLGFVAAVRGYDPAKGASLRTFVKRFVKGGALKAVYGNARHYRRSSWDEHSSTAPVIVHLGKILADGDDVSSTPWDRTEQSWDEREYVRIEDEDDEQARGRLRGAAREWVNLLPERSRELIRRVYWDRERQADIARARGVSKPAITQALKRLHREGRCALTQALSTPAA